jgi:hypothetical protein
MAKTRFFKKFQPETAVVLTNGTSIKFTTLDDLIGWFATDSEYVQNEFELCMRQNRYAITEVAWPEFEEEYVKKKGSMTSKPWSREELSGTRRQVSNPVETLGGERVASVVGVKTAKEVPVTMADESTTPARTSPISTPSKPSDFAPSVGKRAKRKST